VSPTDYGNLGSVVITPTIGGVVGYKQNNSYIKLSTNNVVIKNITFEENTSSVTGNVILTTGTGQGIFYSLGSVVNVGGQLEFSNSYVFNLNVKNEPTNPTLFLTGFITTLNNYESPSLAYTRAKENYFYQADFR